MANSADPDQLASQKPSDLDLHCLQRQVISRFSRTKVNAECQVKEQPVPFLKALV